MQASVQMQTLIFRFLMLYAFQKYAILLMSINFEQNYIVTLTNTWQSYISPISCEISIEHPSLGLASLAQLFSAMPIL